MFSHGRARLGSPRSRPTGLGPGSAPLRAAPIGSGFGSGSVRLGLGWPWLIQSPPSLPPPSPRLPRSQKLNFSPAVRAQKLPRGFAIMSKTPGVEKFRKAIQVDHILVKCKVLWGPWAVGGPSAGWLSSAQLGVVRHGLCLARLTNPIRCLSDS